MDNGICRFNRRSNQRRGGVRYTFLSRMWVGWVSCLISPTYLCLLPLLLSASFTYNLPLCQSVFLYILLCKKKQSRSILGSFFGLGFGFNLAKNTKKKMARLFSVPRQISRGGAAGLARLFVQRQQYQLRHWFVYHLLLLSPFIQH